MECLDCVTLRLWGVSAGGCDAVLGGVDGRRAEALSADFSRPSGQVICGGVDGSLKLSLPTEAQDP